MPFIIFGLAALGFFALRSTRGDGVGGGTRDGWRIRLNVPDDSSREDAVAYEDDPTGDSEPGDAVELLDALDWPYWYGKGSPGTPYAQGAAGVDCKGWVFLAWVRRGIYAATGPNRRATADYTTKAGVVRSIANICDPVPVGKQRPYDVAIYPGHVMLVYGVPNAENGGHSPVIGASGGTSATKGDNPAAHVKLFESATYRHDFVCYGRPRLGEAGVLRAGV